MDVLVIHLNPTEDSKMKRVLAIRYALDILKNINGNKNHGIGLPYRRYFWYGGKYPSDHATKAGEEWCFEYGEEEWVAGKEFDDVAYEASDKDDKGRPKLFTGRVNCSTGEKL